MKATKKAWNSSTGNLTSKSVVNGVETANKFHWDGKFKMLGPNKGSVKFHTAINGHKSDFDLNDIDFANIDPATKAKFQSFVDSFKMNMLMNTNKPSSNPELMKWIMNLREKLMKRKNGASFGIVPGVPGSPKQPIFPRRRPFTKIRRRARAAKTRVKR